MPRRPVMSAGPSQDLARLRQCEALLQLGRASEAAATLSVLLAHDPENPYICTLFAQALLAAGDPARAVELAQRARALSPEDEWPHRVASAAFFRLGKDDEALAAARQAVRLAPHEWRCFVQLAVVAKGRKRTRDEAQAAAAQAMKLAPHEGAGYRLAGKVALAAGRRDEARNFFHQALSIDPQDSDSLNELGRLALGGRGPVGGAKLANAASGFAHAVRTDPNAAVSRYNLDLVIRSFLAKLAYFLFIDAYIVSRGLSHNSAPAARLLPMLALAVPVVIAVRFSSRLSPQLRRHVLEDCRGRSLRLPVLLGIVGALALVTSGVAPLPTRTVAAGIALAAAVICRISLAARVEQSARSAKEGTAQPVFTTQILWCVALALIVFAGLLVVAAFRAPDAATRLVLAAVVPAALGMLVLRVIARRRSPGR